MNNYGSAIRTFTARNVLEAVMPLPPATLDIDTTDWVNQIFETGQRTPLNQIVLGSNLSLKRLGLFCNFGDGLIFNTPYANPIINISAYPYSYAGPTLTGHVSLSSSTKDVNGTGTFFGTPGQANVGDIINVNGVLYRIATVTNPDGPACATLTDYGHACVTQDFGKLVTGSGIPLAANFRWVNNMNYMYERESFMPISTFGYNLNQFFLEASVRISDDITFLTNTIDPTFEDAAVAFDVVADFEITAAANG